MSKFNVLAKRPGTMASILSSRGNQLMRVLVAGAASFVLLLHFSRFNQVHDSTSYISFLPSPHRSALDRSGLLLPPEYSHQTTDSEQCQSKYNTAYLTSLRDGRQSYCNQSVSGSSLDCFSTQITDERKDMFCVAGRASLAQKYHKPHFKLDCTASNSENTDRLGATLNTHYFPGYMYGTGPYFIFNEYVSIVSEADSESFCSYISRSPRNLVLVKREGEGNLWHSLLEIFSLYLTIDAMRITPRDPLVPDAGPLLSTADIASTQIVVLDEHPEGPFYELWKLFAPLPMVRGKELLSRHVHACFDNIIIPLAGGSNPLWQGDWDAGACTHSQLLDTFADRILSQYGLGSASESQPEDSGAGLTLTFIDRRSSRVLVKAPQHLANLQERFLAMKVQAYDFADIPFGEQLKISQNTDVLVGVHGAGLTHSMFLPPESSVVEILPYKLDYKVYRNLAKLKGHKYFSAHAEPGGDGDWHDLDVEMDENRFIELVEAGIRAVLHKGSRYEDVV